MVLSSHPATEIAKNHKVMSRRDIMDIAKRNNEFGQLLQNFLERDLA